MLGWGSLVLGATMPRFGSEDTLAPVGRAQWYHRTLTLDGARLAGWSEGAASELGWHAVGVDFYAYHPIWRLYGGPGRIRGGRMGGADLEKVHFDNLGSAEAIAQVWQRITGGTMVGVGWAAARGDVRSARQVIGVGLHAIQDFYSHSTWIDDPARRERTWLELTPDDLKAVLAKGLSTGGFGPDGVSSQYLHGGTEFTLRSLVRLPAMLAVPLLDIARGRASRRPDLAAPSRRLSRPGPPPGLRYAAAQGINLDSRWQARVGARTRGLGGLDGDAAFDLAAGLAVRETAYWLNCLEQRFGARAETADFWSRVRGDPEGRWTDAFNDPARCAYQFIAAGAYPPRDDAARSWYLRILITAEPRTRRNRYPRLSPATLHLRGNAAQPLARVPIGRATVIGPLTSLDDDLELRLPAAGLRADAQAFRRSPTPQLIPVTNLSQTVQPLRNPR